jgi:hypothetical protein
MACGGRSNKSTSKHAIRDVRGIDGRSETKNSETVFLGYAAPRKCVAVNPPRAVLEQLSEI